MSIIITGEHLKNDYFQLKRALGRRPTCTEFFNRHHTARELIKVFGSPAWSSLLKAVGDKPKVPSRNQVVLDYLRLKKQLGRRPTSVEYTKKYCGLWTLKKIFHGSGWNKLLMAAGERPQWSRFVNRSMLIRDYRALKRKLGRQPKVAEYQKECYGIGMISGILGTPAWTRLLEAAGDKPLISVNLPAEHLITDFLNLQKKLKRRPKLLEYTYQCHTTKVLDRVFGKPGWRNLIAAIGEQAMPENLLTAEHIIQDYLETCAALKRKPTQKEFRKRHRHTAKVFVRVFGKPGFSNLVNAAARFQKRQ